MQEITIHPAVQAFISATQALLSPSVRSFDLTDEECHLIAQHVMDLSNVKTPWCGYLYSLYT